MWHFYGKYYLSFVNIKCTKKAVHFISFGLKVKMEEKLIHL